MPPKPVAVHNFHNKKGCTYYYRHLLYHNFFSSDPEHYITVKYWRPISPTFLWHLLQKGRLCSVSVHMGTDNLLKNDDTFH